METTNNATGDKETVMDIPLNAEVFCSGGHYGSTTCIIMNPTTQKITHVVVKEKQSPHTERLVPEDFIREATPESLNLRCDYIDLPALDEFVGLRLVRANMPLPYSRAGSISYWPYTIAEERTLISKEERIPPGELAFHRGARVEASDGPVGQVDEFLVDPSDGKITHLILREGHLWGKVDVAIPVSQIDHYGADTVYLNLDKYSVEKLPAIPARRWSP